LITKIIVHLHPSASSSEICYAHCVNDRLEKTDGSNIMLEWIPYCSVIHK